MIPVDSLRARLDLGSSDASAGASWHTLPEVSGLASGQAMTTVAGAAALFVCQVGQDLFAFRNVCARCAGSLDGALPVRRLGGSAGDAVLTCPGCGAHYDVRRAGACIDEPALHLDPLPLLVEGTDGVRRGAGCGGRMSTPFTPGDAAPDQQQPPARCRRGRALRHVLRRPSPTSTSTWST